MNGWGEKNGWNSQRDKNIYPISGVGAEKPCVKFQGVKTHIRLAVTWPPFPEMNADIYLSWWKKQLLYLIFHLTGTNNVLCRFPSCVCLKNSRKLHQQHRPSRLSCSHVTQLTLKHGLRGGQEQQVKNVGWNGSRCVGLIWNCTQ